MASSTRAAELISAFTAMGASEAHSQRDVTAPEIVYCVVNGENILAVGEGQKSRLKGLMRGSTCLKHTKAFIVAASNRVHGPQHRYFWLSSAQKDARKQAEAELKARFGDTWIADAEIARTSQAAPYLWKCLRERHPSLCNPALDVAMELVIRDGDILYAAYKVPTIRPMLDELFGRYFA
jgi:hypothetical protein